MITYAYDNSEPGRLIKFGAHDDFFLQADTLLHTTVESAKPQAQGYSEELTRAALRFRDAFVEANFRS